MLLLRSALAAAALSSPAATHLCACSAPPVTFPFPWPSPILPPWLPHVRCCASSARPPQVVVVEQTETPDMLKERNEERAKKGLKRVGGVVCGG